MNTGSAVAEARQATTAVLLLARSAIIYAAANFGAKAIGFFLLPVYTRFLSPADYGIISLAEIIAGVLASVISLGLDPAMRRLYFSFPEAATEQLRYVGTVLWLAFTLNLILGSAVLFMAYEQNGKLSSVPFFPYIALALTTALILQVPQYAMATLQIQSKAGSFGKIVLLLATLTAFSTVVFVAVLHGQAKGMLLGKLIAALAAAAISLPVLWPWLRAGFRWAFIRITLPLALPLIPHQLIALGLVVADRFILERTRTMAEVGIYSVAYTCGMAMFMITSSVMQAWSPVFFDLARDGEVLKSRRSVLSAAIAELLIFLAILGGAAAPVFARFLDPRYSELARLIPLVVAGYLFHGFFALLQLSIMQSKRSHAVLLSSALALAVNVALNFAWIPRWGMYGAAYATIAGYASEAAAAYIFAQRWDRLDYPMKRVSILFVLLVCMVIVSQSSFILAPTVILLAFIAGIAAAVMVSGRTSMLRQWRAAIG